MTTETINNNTYTLKKVRNIFNDRDEESAQFLPEDSLEWKYSAIIDDNKVVTFYKRKGKYTNEIYDVPVNYVNAAIDYYKNNGFDNVNDYRDLLN